MRLLWLTYERTPHPDAICYPATDDDAEFVLALLKRPYPERIRLTEQLARYLTQQKRVAATERTAVACRTPGGLYRSVPWRLAKWLRHVLPATDSVLEDTRVHIEQWQRQTSNGLTCLSPLS
ncbi:MAG: hypothetical protein KDA93_06570 [Planctomycetaceae bacterium]|nr:hypothetical protein [Planctomycetaceae bacterium]